MMRINLIQTAKTLALPLVLCMCYVSPAWAQSWVKKATKSVFTVKTFSADGTPLGSSIGFFTGQQGEAVSCFAPFRGAHRAFVVDAQGKESPVDLILGANETYDVVKFHVQVKKSQPLVIAASAAISQGATVCLLPNAEAKQSTQGTVRKAETFNDAYAYYTVAITMPAEAVGAPLLTDAGEVVGLMQQPASAADTLCYAVSAAFADDLKTSGLSINDPALRAIGIKKALPADEEQAQLTLFMASAALDSLSFAGLVDDFIAQFPRNPEGYQYRAQNLADADRYADADADMAKAISVAEHPDEAHYAYSRLIYQKAVYKPQPEYAPWNLDRALDEARKAYDIQPIPAYKQQQAYVLYAQKNYAEAFSVYEELFTTNLRSADLFYEASQCKAMMNDSVGQLQMLDSALTTFSRPYLKEAAPYILLRAQTRMDVGRYRDAVADLIDYEQLMQAQLTDRFYYMRHQAEVGGKLYQQALNDINRAIEMNPQSELYLAEKASLLVRVGMYDEAMAAAQDCIKVAPQLSDGYLFLGLAQCLKGQKTDGLKNLQRAKELGDDQADGLIEKYAR
ncbi:MAG: serine protease [Prevotella sp.]|nr:serine protease [Prevotella sp.]